MTDQFVSEMFSAEKLKLSSTRNDDIDPTIYEKSSNKKIKTEIKNVGLFNSNSSFSAEESVFSIDHLLEFIFAELDRGTLLNCRLVSRRWVYFSSKFLQKIITFKFQNALKDQVLYCDGNKNRPIKDLVTLMNDSTDGNFPCTSFEFRNNYVGKIDSMAQRFFNAHGHLIRKLEFVFNLLVSDLKRLLLIQAPNLEELKCSCVTWKYTESESRSNKLETEEEGRWRRESLFNETAVGPKPLFKSLKKFKCVSEGTPRMFLQQLLECSPNLVEVFLRPKCLPYLVRPVNRLHLLKQLAVHVEAAYVDSLADVANNHEGNWAVEDVHLLTYTNEWEDWDPAVASKAREVVRKLLEGCAPTCQKLRWDEGFQDFQFPHMPKVKDFSLYYYETVWTEEIISNFSEIERLGDTFPNLKYLEVKTDFDIYLTNGNVFGDSVPAPVPSVRNISFKFHPDPILLESFRNMFPNAVITETGFGR